MWDVECETWEGSSRFGKDCQWLPSMSEPHPQENSVVWEN